MEQKYIDIGGRNFTFDKLVMGQIEQLQTEFNINTKQLTTETFKKIVEANIDNACKFFAIIIYEKDVELENKDVAALTKFLKFKLNDAKCTEMLDFFFKNGKKIYDVQKKDGK